MRGFLWDPPGSLHITTLHGSLILLGGLTPPDPPLFRTLGIRLHYLHLIHLLVPARKWNYTKWQNYVDFIKISLQNCRCLCNFITQWTIKRATMFLIITLAFLGRFLYFLYQWKQEGILYKKVNKIYHFTLTVSPHYLVKLKPRINSTF